jgi:hypothetical protein
MRTSSISKEERLLSFFCLMKTLKLQELRQQSPREPEKKKAGTLNVQTEWTN